MPFVSIFFLIFLLIGYMTFYCHLAALPPDFKTHVRAGVSFIDDLSRWQCIYASYHLTIYFLKTHVRAGVYFYFSLHRLHRCIVYFEVSLHMSRKSSSNLRTLTNQKNRLSGQFFLHISKTFCTFATRTTTNTL